MSMFLDRDDMNELTGILAGLYQLSDAGIRGRKAVLEVAGLGELLPHLDMEGSTLFFVRRLVDLLSKYGETSPNTQALGALLRTILSMGDLGQEDATRIAGIITEYRLVGDDGYIEKLQKQYGLEQSGALQHVTEPSDRTPVSLETERQIKLTSQQLKQLHNALLSAFDREAFRRLLRFELNVELDAISSAGENYGVEVFNVVEWAEHTGRLDQLIRGAAHHNPGNPLLQSISVQLLDKPA